MALIALFVPVLLSLWSRSPDESLYWILFQIGIAIVAGVGIFGSENPARTYRFLAIHGVRPSLVWLVRMAVWVLALGVLFGLAIFGIMLSGGPRQIPYPALVAVWYLALAISVFCGMTIRRGITAGMVSLMLIFALALPGASLAHMGMMPIWVLILVPTLFLLVSFVWTKEWMLDRPGASKWLKLAVLLVVPFVALFAAYATDRVVSVPTLEPARDAKLFAIRTSANIPADENAAELYRQAGRAITPDAQTICTRTSVKNWGDMPANVKTWYQNNAKALGVDSPGCRKTLLSVFVPIDKLTFFSRD